MKKLIIVAALFVSTPSYAFLQEVKNEVQEKWSNAQAGDNDFYLPLRTWHNRATYDHNKIKEFNESPWGLGFGKSYKDAQGDWHGFYAMGFADSHSDFQPIAGYGYTKNFYHNDWYAGVGYTVFMTARKDIMSYVPFPAALPLASVGYKNINLTGTYIPGGSGNGNVAFFWGRYTF